MILSQESDEAEIRKVSRSANVVEDSDSESDNGKTLSQC
jgi:hypothetical protein